MKFLHYPEPDGTLPAHVDLHRVDSTGRRTTCTFLLYLADCAAGGDTALLESLDGDSALAHSGGLVPGTRNRVAVVTPRRGRLFVFPHICPHEALAAVEVPKLLLRGDVLPGADYGQDEVTHTTHE